MTSDELIPVPVGWRVIVEMCTGKGVSDGGIDLSATLEAQNHLMYLAQIKAVGEAAFGATTKGGIDMTKWSATPEVGDYVIVPAYGGQPIRRRKKGDKDRPLLKILNDTDVIAIVSDPADYYSWVDG